MRRRPVDGEVVSGPVLGGLHHVFDELPDPDSTFAALQATTGAVANSWVADTRNPRL